MSVARPRVIVWLLLLLAIVLLVIGTFSFWPPPTRRFWRTVAWEQKDKAKFFQLDVLGQVSEAKSTSLRLCLPVGKTAIRVRACNAANACSEWIVQTVDVEADGEPCE